MVCILPALSFNNCLPIRPGLQDVRATDFSTCVDGDRQRLEVMKSRPEAFRKQLDALLEGGVPSLELVFLSSFLGMEAV